MLLINTPKSFCSKVGNMYFVTIDGYAIGIVRFHKLFRTQPFKETPESLIPCKEATREEIMLALEGVKHDHDRMSRVLENSIKLALNP